MRTPSKPGSSLRTLGVVTTVTWYPFRVRPNDSLRTRPSYSRSPRRIMQTLFCVLGMASCTRELSHGCLLRPLFHQFPTPASHLLHIIP